MKTVPTHILDDDSRRLMARAAELAVRESYDTVFSDFLTPREQRLFYYAVAAEGHGDRLFFWGGAVGAERRCAVLVPQWLLYDVPTADAFGEERENYLASLIENGTLDLTPAVTALRIRASEYASLTHRDYLGALVSLGVERRVLGDIDVKASGEAVVFLSPRMAPFVTENLTRVGGDAVRVTAAELPAGYEIARSFTRLETSVASPRLDGVVRALTGLSRDDAAALVSVGDAEINYFPCTEPDRHVEDGSTLTIRGYGKYIIDSADAQTRRGRQRLVARKYT